MTSPSYAQINESSGIRATYTPTPIYTLLAYKPAQSMHLIDLNEDLILAQIATFDDLEQAELFMNFHSRIKLNGVRLKYDGTIHYMVFLGLYEDEDTARWAHESFQEQNPHFQAENFKRIRLGDLKQFITTETADPRPVVRTSIRVPIQDASVNARRAANQDS